MSGFSKPHYRQGDVFVEQVDAVPDGATKKGREGDLILAYGEVTGHAHRIKDRDVEEFEINGQRFLVLKEAATITHEEHAAVTLPAGNYCLVIQREYSPEAIRNVAD